MTDESNAEGTPFALRGLNNIFSQRQADIFGNLQVLEDAHKKVHKETKSERKFIEKLTWKVTNPDLEPLEEQKETCETRKRDASVRLSPQINSPPAFKVPFDPPRSRGHRGGGCNPRFDTSKWTHYSLADVDEDAGVERSIANDLLRQLKQRRLETEDDRDMTNEDIEVKRSARILFRPTRGKKKRKIDDASASTVPQTSFTIHEVDDYNQSGEADEAEETSLPFRSRRSRQAARRVHLHNNNDDDEDGDEKEEEEASNRQSPSQEVSPSFELFDDAPNGL